MSISGVIGTSWPWNVFPQWVDDDDVIDLAIRDVLFTALGERKMNPAFGSDTLSLVFENKGVLMVNLARREILLAIQQNLPAVKVLNIDVTEGPNDNDPVDILIDYEYQGVRGTMNVPVATP
jgi:phage baseplate assembly protein W